MRSQTQTSPSSRSRRRPARRGIGPGLVLLSLVAGLAVLVVAANAASARNELRHAQHDFDAARDAIVSRRDPDANAALDRAERRLRSARSRLGGFPAKLFAVIPVVGSPVAALDGAVAAALEAVDAGRLIASAAARFPTSGAAGIDGHDLSPFHDASVGADADLAAAAELLDGSARALDGPSGAFLPQVSGPAREVQRLVTDVRDQLDSARDGIALLADLTDAGTQARLLVLSQDSMELRATGGYVGSYGVLHFDHGTVQLDDFAATEDLPPTDPPMDPPDGLAEAMPAGWELSNATWWPDFPTSASTAREMFARQGGGEVDGVIALTEYAMARLVGALGPIDVPGYDEPVVEDGFADRVLYEVELKRPQDHPRKRFLVKLSEIVFRRLFSLDAGEVPGVADALGAAIGAGALKEWFASDDRQALIGDSTISGALPVTDGDFLMLVDSNLTAGKANRDLVRDVTYTVRRDDYGRLVARLDIEVRNEGNASPINEYYNGYLRIYVPSGVTTYDPEHPVFAEPADDGDYGVLRRSIFIRPHESENVRFEYYLPERISDRAYGLTWVRQAGTPADSLTAVIGSRRYHPPTGGRALHVERSLSANPVREWLHDRWLFRKLGL